MYTTFMIVLLTLLTMVVTILTGIGIAWFICVFKRDSITFILASSKARVPERSTLLSAGYDLRAAESCVIRPGEHVAVKTGIKVQLPVNTYGRIASRSGLSFNNGIEVGAGVIDQDYTSEIMVILYNHGSIDFEVVENNRIAQLIVQCIVYPKTKVIKNLNNSSVSSLTGIRLVRGDGGLGSTGVV
jgi:dUTP pyrophosphatase